MTATTFSTTAFPTTRGRARPRGIDLLVMRLSLAGLRWARRRADRPGPTREQQIRAFETSQSAYRREHDAALLVSRVR